MLITELRDAYREANKSFEFSIQLENMKDEVRIYISVYLNMIPSMSSPQRIFCLFQVFNKTDTNKDGVIDLEEFKISVEENQKKAQNKDDVSFLHLI